MLKGNKNCFSGKYFTYFKNYSKPITKYYSIGNGKKFLTIVLGNSNYTIYTKKCYKTATKKLVKQFFNRYFKNKQIKPAYKLA